MMNKNIPYPDNLIIAIFGWDLDSNEAKSITNDMRNGLNDTLETLSPREESMIRLRYTEHLSLQQVGEVNKLSGSRVGQIISKGFRKLRHPSRAKHIIVDIDMSQYNPMEEGRTRT